MEQLLETIELDVEEKNELAFKVRVEGAEQGPSRVRLVCENSDVSYMFDGYLTGEPDVVQFDIPPMKNRLSEGLYPSRVEVLIENKYFAPVAFNLNFKKRVSVVAESIQKKPAKPEVSVTAQVISRQPVKPIVEAQKQPVPVQATSTEEKQSLLKKKFEEKKSLVPSDEKIREIAQNLVKNIKLK